MLRSFNDIMYSRSVGVFSFSRNVRENVGRETSDVKRPLKPIALSCNQHVVRSRCGGQAAWRVCKTRESRYLLRVRARVKSAAGLTRNGLWNLAQMQSPIRAETPCKHTACTARESELFLWTIIFFFSTRDHQYVFLACNLQPKWTRIKRLEIDD